jgi:integrase
MTSLADVLAIKSAQPAAAGVKVERWRNALSDTRRAIKLSGLGGKIPALKVPLTEEWERLVSRLDDRWVKNAIERFGMFCSACQIAPSQIDDGVLGQYRSYLEETQLTKDPAHTVSYLIRYWNRCVEQVSGWSGASLSKPNRCRKYALDWSELPQSLGQEFREFQAQSLNPYPFDIDAPRPVKPRTAKQRDALLRRLAAALAAQGVPKENLRSLADMVRPDRLKLGLKFFIDRNDGKLGAQVKAIADLALLIASRWSKLSDDDLRQIKHMCSRVGQKRRGLTEKNKARLRQFSDDRTVLALLNLPRQLVGKAKRLPRSRRRALMVQTALAIEILLVAPIRLGNLVELDRNRHFTWARSDGKRVLHLVIPAEEVKNDIDLEFPLPDEVVDLLEFYMRTYQPDLVEKSSSSLFPGKGGRPKRPESLWRQISSTIKRETGLEMNPHLFRHLVVMLFLEANPGEYEVARRVLGHKSITTTIEFYAGLETAAAVRHFDKTILRLRSTCKPAADEPENRS